MVRPISFWRHAALSAAMALLSSAVPAQETPGSATPVQPRGTIVGLLATSKAPLSGVVVTASSLSGGIRSTISGSDGLFSFADVPAGVWSLTVSADGSTDKVISPVTVIGGRATRHDVTLEVISASATSPAPPAPAVTRAVPPSPSTNLVAEALQAPDSAPEHDTVTPLADVGYLGWMNGTSRERAPIFDTKFFTPEIRFDANYLQSSNRPIDHTIVGSSEEFRSGEFQIEQVSFGGDFHWDNVHARFLSMFGMFATTTPRNDASSAVGQWDLGNAYRYFSEANAGYHFDVNHGLNVDVGVFVSYLGLFSYYNYDNWTYQPSYVSSNTPWFFNGLRVQWWPTQHLKIEPWLINGWQSYAKFNRRPGIGGQILWIPNDSLKLVFNNYGVGQDNVSCQTANTGPSGGSIDTLCQPQNGGNPLAAAGSYVGAGGPVDYSRVKRIHSDDSIVYKYYDAHGLGGSGMSRAAFSYTFDIGCEYGGGVTCTGGKNRESFLGMMAYNRLWFHDDLYAVTVGGGFMNNPGRYLALAPSINGATAATGSPYFTQQPGQKLFQWDTQINLQYMPREWITWWSEATFRHSNVPYWSGSGGVTTPGGNTGSPASCVGGGADPSTGNCQASDWFPDLRTREFVYGAGVLVKF